MKERYEVRQFIKHNGNKRLEMVSSKKTLEEAEKLYSFLCKYHSDVYFEIVKISYEEERLKTNGVNVNVGKNQSDTIVIKYKPNS